MSHQFSQPGFSWLTRTCRSAASFLLGASLVAFSLPASAQTEPQRSPALSSPTPSELAASTLPDGTYLYGQAPEADHIGSEYLVFEVNQGEVVGAFYMPHSSFDCFTGGFQGDRLALNIVDSYAQVTHSYAIAMQPIDRVASADGAVSPLGLEGYHSIAAVSENDQRILNTCKTAL